MMRIRWTKRDKIIFIFLLVILFSLLAGIIWSI